jgi:hypothetical protein
MPPSGDHRHQRFPEASLPDPLGDGGRHGFGIVVDQHESMLAVLERDGVGRARDEVRARGAVERPPGGYFHLVWQPGAQRSQCNGLVRLHGADQLPESANA